MDVQERKKIIAEWLTSTRARHFRDDKHEEPWSQDDVCDRIEAEAGWKIHRPNYSGWERGATNPKPDTLAKLIAFWARYDEPGPDFTPRKQPPPEPTLASALNALAVELRESRKDRRALMERVALLETAVRLLKQGDDPTTTAPASPQGSAG